MPDFAKFVLRRIFLMLVTLFVLTATMYGLFVLLTPPEVRAMAFVPPGRVKPGAMKNFLETVIREHGFRKPFPVQYAHWIGQLLQGNWGFSPRMSDEVLDVLLQRTPATAELLLFSVVLFIPLGIISGVVSGWKHGRWPDFGFRFVAFAGTSIPPFVLGLMLLSVFYVGLHWFPVGRLSGPAAAVTYAPDYKTYTHLYIIDGLLNLRFDLAFDALRHLVLPAFTLSLAHWATLGRVTRAAIIEELGKDYVVTARGKGLSMRTTVWRHIFRNAAVPGLNSIALSSAMLLTGAFVVEIIFSYPGISAPLAVTFKYPAPDVDLAMGFAIYSVLLVLPLMFILDILQAVADPRIREGGADL
ncbi:MAG: ABC transporter permease [Anaerolineae bacterium]|nr:ABC transporter permease [Anaerolineae bacterium]